MSVEENAYGPKRLVLLVEDKLPPLLNVLLSIQSILFVSMKKRLRNAPALKDTEIRVLHLVEKGQKGDPEHFERIKRALEARDQNENSIQQLDYQYQVLEWDTTDYPATCEDCARGIIQEIQHICAGKDYSIILDAILLESKDEDELRHKQHGGRVLSHCLFEHFSDYCIPYTNYAEGTIHTRKAWSHGVSLGYEMFQRQQIVTEGIFKPFRKMLYRQLRIGDETT